MWFLRINPEEQNFYIQVLLAKLAFLPGCGAAIAIKYHFPNNQDNVDSFDNADSFDNPESSMLKILENEKAKFIKEEKKVPYELEQKIIAQKQLELIAAEKKRQEFIEKVKKAPKDGKGNPVLSDAKPITEGFESLPKEGQVITK